VLVNGARQAGKSTLVRAIAAHQAAEWRDLDHPLDRQSALEDPVGFVSFDGPMVIDEIQRAPELLLAIKVKVDADPKPGHSYPNWPASSPGRANWRTYITIAITTRSR
jgi:predicted AAA+ superfamily ATPase